MIKKFEIGKAYQHASGVQMFICGMADTIGHGRCFIAESGWNRVLLAERIKQAKENKEQVPVGGFDKRELMEITMKEEDGIENWEEIPKGYFITNNFE